MANVSIDDAIKIGIDHQNRGDMANAQSVYDAILKVQPGNSTVLYLLGRMNYSQGKLNEAIEFLGKAVEFKTEIPDAYTYYGRALAAQKRTGEALSAHLQGVQRDIENPKTFIPLLETLSRHAVRAFPSPHGDIRFACLSDIALYRGETLLTKEPETLEWIDSFDRNSVFWDIGANVGVYTLYAAKAGKLGHILAFEPSSENYLLLNRNIEANGVDHIVQAYCLAFNDQDLLASLHMQSTEPGGALSSFATQVGYDGNTFTARFHQGMIGFSIDAFVRQFDPPFPTYLKIDVDGIEDKIIAGAGATLADPRLLSLSIELDDHRPDYRDAVVAQIEAGGLRLKSKRHAAAFNQGAFSGIYNFQFWRG